MPSFEVLRPSSTLTPLISSYLPSLIAFSIAGMLKTTSAAPSSRAAAANPQRAKADLALFQDGQLLIACCDPLVDPQAMLDLARRWAAEHQVPSDRFEFQMLHGIRRDVQTRLVRDGCRVRIYVPFGCDWFPYFMRRLGERPANVLFVLRSLFEGG